MKHVTLIIILSLTVNLVFGQKARLIDASNSGLIDNDLESISVDENGNKWIGTAKHGLIKFNDGHFETLNKENSVIQGDYVAPVFVDSKGNVWVSYSHSDTLLTKFDGESWTVFTSKEVGKNVSFVIDIAEDAAGKVYFGGSGGVLVYADKWFILEIPKENCTVRALDIARDGSIAIGHNEGLLTFIDGKWNSLTHDNSELQLNVVRAVKFRENGELFVGYGGGFGNGGFSIVQGGSWSHFNKENSKVPDHMVRDIEIDANGTVWMATNNGVIEMNGKKIKPIYFRDGMFQNVILDIAIEGKTVWVATNFGLVKVE